MDDPKPTVIKIMGLGGGGSNAVNRMIDLGLDGVEFIAANTDAQALAQSLAPNRILLGEHSTRGLGAGGKPEVGEHAADESREYIKKALAGADMVFLTAGMGGGTGTGAIAIAAEVARSVGALAVAVVTVPFTFEASRRRNNAEAGLAKLKQHADCLIMVPNDKLLGLLPRSTPLDVALRVADEVLRQGVQGITELITKPGLINMDFANIKQLMQTAGTSMMAIGQGKGENKAVDAVRQALKMPLLDLRTVNAANGILVHFTGGDDLSLYEVSQAAAELNTAAPNAEVIFGATVDPSMEGRAQVILVATGLDNPSTPAVVETDMAEPVLRRPVMPKPVVEEAARQRVEPEPEGYLADALFHQVVNAKPTETPLVSADARPGPAAPPASQNNLDVPAFLRRRRSRASCRKATSHGPQRRPARLDLEPGVPPVPGGARRAPGGSKPVGRQGPGGG
jgi:cell division protein FtsZ